MLSTVLGTEDIVANNTRLCLLGAYFLGMAGSKIIKKSMSGSNNCYAGK